MNPAIHAVATPDIRAAAHAWEQLRDMGLSAETEQQARAEAQAGCITNQTVAQARAEMQQAAELDAVRQEIRAHIAALSL